MKTKGEKETVAKQKKRPKRRKPERPKKSIWRKAFFALIAVCCLALLLGQALAAILSQRQMILQNQDIIFYHAPALSLLCIIPGFVNAAVLLGIFYTLYESDVTWRTIPAAIAQKRQKARERKKKRWYPRVQKNRFFLLTIAGFLLIGVNMLPYAAYYGRTEVTSEGVIQYNWFNQVKRDYVFERLETISVDCRRGSRGRSHSSYYFINYRMQFSDGYEETVSTSGWRSRENRFAAILQLDDYASLHAAREISGQENMSRIEADPEIREEYYRRFVNPREKL